MCWRRIVMEKQYPSPLLLDLRNGGTANILINRYDNNYERTKGL
jgi:hypothetical protein